MYELYRSAGRGVRPDVYRTRWRPLNLTRSVQLLLGAMVLAVNLVAYLLVFARMRRRSCAG